MTQLPIMPSIVPNLLAWSLRSMGVSTQRLVNLALVENRRDLHLSAR